MNRREALAALVSLPEVTRISVARVKPSDVLVIESEGYMTQETRERIKATMSQVWPNQKTIVLDKSLRLKVIEGK